jgi:hypothetical protein
MHAKLGLLVLLLHAGALELARVCRSVISSDWRVHNKCKCGVPGTCLLFPCIPCAHTHRRVCKPGFIHIVGEARAILLCMLGKTLAVCFRVGRSVWLDAFCKLHVRWGLSQQQA